MKSPTYTQIFKLFKKNTHFNKFKTKLYHFSKKHEDNILGYYVCVFAYINIIYINCSIYKSDWMNCGS